MHSVDDFAVVPLASDVDVDDKVSESHCSDGTRSCMTTTTTGFDYIDVPSCFLDNCSDYYCDSREDSAAAAVGVEGSFSLPAVLESDFELVQVLATLVVPQSWNCSVSRLILAETAVSSAAMVELADHFSAYPIHQSIPYYVYRGS